MKVVLGGSRNLQSIPEEIKEQLAEWTHDKAEFLVGDAPGSDLAIQMALKRIGSERVTVFSSAGYVRHNVGNWPSEFVDSGLRSKSSAVHAFKDRHMTAVADLGLMLWDSESAGTLSNVIDLVDQGKSCSVWMALEGEIYTFDNDKSLGIWLKRFPLIALEANKRLKTFRRRKEVREKEIQPDLFG